MSSVSCISCQAKLEAAAKFCSHCGAPQQSHESLKKVVSEIERERKFVCILFADLSGFTSLSEKLDPEEMTELMDACFKRLGSVVRRFDGYIDKFMGDCVMALFGAPLAHEDDPLRAVECALALQEEMKVLREERKLDLKLSVGVNSGIVIAGGVGAEGKFEYTVMGDAVNVAQRVQKAAPAGEVWITGNIFRATEKAFESQSLSTIAVKGKSQAVEVYRLLRKRKSRNDRETIHRSFATLVGREREVSLIDRSLESCLKDSGAMIWMRGDAGVGKSRLLHETKRRAHQKGIDWIDLGCESITREPPLGVFLRLLRKLQERPLAFDVLTSDERRDLEMVLEGGEVLAEESADRARQRTQKLCDAIVKVVLNLASWKPVGLSIEDIHWMDSISLRVLQDVARSISAHRLFLILTSRPDFEAQWPRAASVTMIELQPIKGPQADQIVKNLLQIESVPKELSQLIRDKADGNPLFIEEIIKSLVDQRRIRFDQGAWQIDSNLSDHEIAGSLQGLIASRIDRLDRTSKAVLQLAAVVGRTFDDKILREAGEWKEALYDALKELRRKELIFEFDSKDDRIVYIFKHALTRDVAYESLLQKKRKAYHAEIARVIEESPRPQDDRAEILAHHYSRAENYEKAVPWSLAVAKKAADKFDNDQAIAHYKKSLELAGHLSHQSPEGDLNLISIQLKLADILDRLGRYSEVEQIYLSQIETGNKLQNISVLARAYRRLGEISRKRGQVEVALDWLQKSLRLAEDHGDIVNLVRTSKSLGNTYKLRHDVKQALFYLHKGLDRVGELNDRKLEADFWNDIAVVHIDAQDFEASRKCLEKCIRICESLEDAKVTLTSAAINMGVCYYFAKDLQLALEMLERAAKLARETGDRQSFLMARHNSGEIFMEWKNYDRALSEFEACAQLAQQVGNDFERINNLSLSAMARFKLGQTSASQEILLNARQEAEKRQYWGPYCEATTQLAEIHMSLNQLDQARSLLDEALHRMNEIENAPLLNRVSAIRSKIQ